MIWTNFDKNFKSVAQKLFVFMHGPKERWSYTENVSCFVVHLRLNVPRMKHQMFDSSIKIQC